MEYARGGELFHKITTEGRYEEPVARVVFAQLCSAVNHLVRILKLIYMLQ